MQLLRRERLGRRQLGAGSRGKTVKKHSIPVGSLLPVHSPPRLLPFSKLNDKVRNCNLSPLYLRHRQKGCHLGGPPSPPLDAGPRDAGSAFSTPQQLPRHQEAPPLRPPYICLPSIPLAPPLTVWSITSSMCISWELLRNAESQAAPPLC